MILGINGRFLGARATGVQRFAREVVGRLWARAGGGALLLPRGVEPPADLPPDVRTDVGSLSGHLWERIELPRRAAALSCDVVLHPANTLPAAGGRHVVVVHDVEPLERPQLFAPAFVAWYRWAVAPAVRRAARVVTVSQTSAEAIARVLGIDPERIAVADQGAAPLDEPASADEVTAVRLRFALGGPYLLAVGGGDPRKNTALLGAALDRWRARRSRGEPLPAPPALVVVSGGVDRLFGRGEDARAAGELRLGRVDDATLRSLYTGASALAFPSVGSPGTELEFAL